ncbi:hypothetical protein CBS101457_001218 [Exobasidium rhododendri]|nr:hypothetical protein CBS101457_001218 [Exobasidium rhododendri]
MLLDQFFFLGSSIGTFLTCFALLKLGIRLLPSANQFEVLADFDAATNIMDPNTILAFIVGLVASIGVLIYISSGKAKPFLDPKNWQDYKLVEKKQISENTAQYRFRLPSENGILGLPIGQHISVQAEVNGKNVMRSYTPVSSDDDRGFFDLLIKTYPQGNISQHVSKLRIGDPLQVKGPKGQMKYSPDLAKHIGMIAGGTGITPMLQIIRAIVKNPKDKTKVDLIYANVNVNDILLREELDNLAKQYPQQFNVLHYLNNPPEKWQGGSGFVTKESIQERLPAPADDIKILMCGPPPMINAMKKHLEEIGYEKPNTVSKMPDQVFCF